MPPRNRSKKRITKKQFFEFTSVHSNEKIQWKIWFPKNTHLHFVNTRSIDRKNFFSYFLFTLNEIKIKFNIFCWSHRGEITTETLHNMLLQSLVLFGCAAFRFRFASIRSDNSSIIYSSISLYSNAFYEQHTIEYYLTVW